VDCHAAFLEPSRSGDAVRDAGVPASGVEREPGARAARGGLSQRAKDANERADNYMLALVLFASALFFAGISTKLSTYNARLITLGLGWVLFLGTVIWLATFPVQLTT
jgi:hypothetical protein